MENDKLTTIPWNFTVFPSQKFKDNLGASLLKYAQGTKTYDEVKKDAVVNLVAEKVQANVKDKIQTMTGTAVTQVNVIVADVKLEEAQEEQ